MTTIKIIREESWTSRKTYIKTIKVTDEEQKQLLNNEITLEELYENKEELTEIEDEDAYFETFPTSEFLTK